MLRTSAAISSGAANMDLPSVRGVVRVVRVVGVVCVAWHSARGVVRPTMSKGESRFSLLCRT